MKKRSLAKINYDIKSHNYVLTQKEMTSTSKRRAEHPFEGQKTQHPTNPSCETLILCQ